MSTPRERQRKLVSAAMRAMCSVAVVLIVGILAVVMFYLVSIGAGSLNAAFFTGVPTGDVTNPGGMRHAILGTLVLVGLASLMGVPLGMLTGVYLSEYNGGRLGAPVRFLCDVLAGVPSIVVAILGYELLVVPLGNFNGWAGAFALGFIMTPIVARTTEEMLRLVPGSYREASFALGASKARTVLGVVIPAAGGSIVTGVMLALARVAGETAPLLFTALGSRLVTLDPSKPFPSLTVQIYTYATGPYPKQKELAWAGILVLIAILFIMNILLRVAASRMARVKA